MPWLLYTVIFLIIYLIFLREYLSFFIEHYVILLHIYIYQLWPNLPSVVLWISCLFLVIFPSCWTFAPILLRIRGALTLYIFCSPIYFRKIPFLGHFHWKISLFLVGKIKKSDKFSPFFWKMNWSSPPKKRRRSLYWIVLKPLLPCECSNCCTFVQEVF